MWMINMVNHCLNTVLPEFGVTDIKSSETLIKWLIG